MDRDRRLHGPQPTMVYPHSWGFNTVWAGVVRGDNRFRRRLIGVVDARKAICFDHGIVYSPGAGGFTSPSQSAISQLGWGFHNVRGGIDPGDHRFRPRFVGVVKV